MDYSTLTDESLLRLILHRRVEALRELYNRYNQLVFGLALHSVGERESAEEITQDVFMRVWDKAATYRSESGKLSTWLMSITRNRSIDMLRRRNVRPEGRSVAWDDLPVMAQPYTDGAEGAADLALERQRVRRALAALPHEQRRAIELAFFQGLSHGEISAALSEPLGTVKTRIRLGMHKLRDLLAPELKETKSIGDPDRSI